MGTDLAVVAARLRVDRRAARPSPGTRVDHQATTINLMRPLSIPCCGRVHLGSDSDFYFNSFRKIPQLLLYGIP